MRGWIGMVRALGEAFVALLRAEAEALVHDFARAGKALSRALLLGAVAGAFAFWAIGLLVYLGVELLALTLPRWGAVAVVLGAFLLVAGGLAAWTTARLRAVETPLAAWQRRRADTDRWWRERFGDDEEPAPPEIEEDLP
jgi:uncharacterized membrane protein YqjE